MEIIKAEYMENFQEHLYMNEKSSATVEKYMRAVKAFCDHLEGREVTKKEVTDYRQKLLQRYRAQTVNGRLSAINAFLDFCGWSACKAKLLKVQRRAFIQASRELSQEEYGRLLRTAQSQGKERLYLIMLTLCTTGIRISELQFITAEAVKAGAAEIRLKGKVRTVILTKQLCSKLSAYLKRENRSCGFVFQTKNGNPMDRSNICHEMKRLCREAGVDETKVFPHNLRHLFARTYYAAEKNLAHLADILGHSQIETTRIYVAVSASRHEQILGSMHLIL